MSDPERLLEKGEGFAATLLRAGCEERPSVERVQRTLRAIGVGTAVGSVAAEAAGSGAGAVVPALAGSTAAKIGASTVTLAFAAKWVVIGGLSGLLTLGAASELSGRRPSQPSSITPVVSASVPASRPSLNTRGTLHATAQPSVDGDDHAENASSPNAAPPSREGNTRAERPPRARPALTSATEAPPLKDDHANGASRGDILTAPSTPSMRAPLPSQNFAVSKSAPSGAQKTSPDDDSDGRAGGGELSVRLNNQVMLIDGAWAAVKRNDPAGALHALSGYERTFPALDLHPEVLFLRMTAQANLGQKTGARADAARIVALYPRSVQATRARDLLARP